MRPDILASSSPDPFDFVLFCIITSKKLFKFGVPKFFYRTHLPRLLKSKFDKLLKSAMLNCMQLKF